MLIQAIWPSTVQFLTGSATKLKRPILMRRQECQVIHYRRWSNSRNYIRKCDFPIPEAEPEATRCAELIQCQEDERVPGKRPDPRVEPGPRDENHGPGTTSDRVPARDVQSEVYLGEALEVIGRRVRQTNRKIRRQIMRSYTGRTHRNRNEAPYHTQLLSKQRGRAK
jgi:hypothetical protein